MVSYLFGGKRKEEEEMNNIPKNKRRLLFFFGLTKKILLFMMTYHYDTFRLIRCHLITCHDAKKEEEIFLQHSLI